MKYSIIKVKKRPERGNIQGFRQNQSGFKQLRIFEKGEGKLVIETIIENSVSFTETYCFISQS
ncbi:MAG: hypothetical protein FWD40_10615 [Treponema sp.]|nr:hypothetical protein [Treponema sp.]